jgi:glycosyltransferase domain-containing protein
MITIIIPTYNRSAKLERTLAYYNVLLNKIEGKVIILDGSESDHLILNKKNCDKYNFVIHQDNSQDLPNTLVDRIFRYLLKTDQDSIIFLGNDEDVFIEDYLINATNFMNDNLEYSTYIGRYVTLGKPFLCFNRFTHPRSVITNFDINQNSPSRRIGLLSKVILSGCSPLYYGCRRVSQLKKSLEIQASLDVWSSYEIVDQIIVSYQGKIKFSPELMLFRDESKIAYIQVDNRQDNENYFNEAEYDKIINCLKQYGGQELLNSAESFLDSYIRDFTHRSEFCLALQKHNKYYSAYTTFLPIKNNSIQKNICFSNKVFVIFLELITYQIDILRIKKKYSKKLINIWLKKLKTNAK